MWSMKVSKISVVVHGGFNSCFDCSGFVGHHDLLDFYDLTPIAQVRNFLSMPRCWIYGNAKQMLLSHIDCKHWHPQTFDK